MREFFKAELDSLKAKTGLNQLEHFTAMKDGAGNSIAKEQITILIDSMVYVCSQFPEIPDNHKKTILQAAMFTDEHFTGLHAKWVVKTLNQVRGRYFKQEGHQKDENIYDKVNLTDEERNEVDRVLNEFKASLVGGVKSVPKMTSDEIKKEGIERDDTLKGELDKLAPAPGYKTFIVRGIHVQALSLQHAEELLKRAIDRGEIEEVQE